MTALKITSLPTKLMTFVILIALLSFPVGAVFASGGDGSQYPVLQGAGTPADPYRISECSQLAHVNVEPSASYRMINDIWNCYNVTPIDDFTGKYFDGNMNYLRYSINDTSHDNVGLFRHVAQGSEIRNLYSDDARIDSRLSSSTNQVAGSLVAINDGTIRGIKFTNGNMLSKGTVGGLVGINNGKISGVEYNTGFSSVSDSSVIFGGLVGVNTGSISEVRSSSHTSEWPVKQINSSICGGVIGKQSGGTINHVFSLGSLPKCSDDSITGGIVGEISGESALTNSFARIQGYDGTNLDGAIVGSNPDHIDLSTTFYDGNALPSATCDANGDTTCTKVTDWKDFYNTNSPVLSSWNIYNTSGSSGERSAIWKTDYTLSQLISWYGSNSSGPWFTDYMPELNSYDGGAALSNPVEVTKLNASATSATFNFQMKSCYTDNEYGQWEQCRFNPAAKEYDIYVGTVPELQPGEEANVNYSLLTTVQANSSGKGAYTAQNLDPSVYYDFIIRGRNGLGETEFSDSIEVRPIPQAINAPSEVETTSGSATIQWDQSLVASAYDVDYKKSSDSTWSTLRVPNFPDTHVKVSHLESDTNYDFRVRVSNIRGSSAPSNVLTLSTSVQNAYNISSCEDLQGVNGDLDGHYTLTKDIDCSNSSTFNQGKGFIPLGIDTNGFDPQNGFDFNSLVGFSGTLDGNGHKISNIQVDLQGAIGGLFGYINGGTVKNLTLDGGHVVGLAGQDGDGHTDAQMAYLVGGLSALASNATIDNVTSNINITNNPSDGTVALSAGLIGGVIPQNFGANSEETNVNITNSRVTGNIAGMGSAGLIGATVPLDVLTAIFGYDEIMSNANGPDDLANLFGSRINVNISDSSVTGTLGCTLICAGLVGVNTANLTMNNVTRNGTTGATETPVDQNAQGIMSILQMLGPISVGAVGINLPIAMNNTSSTLTMDNVNINGAIAGTMTAGIIGISLPSVRFDFAGFQSTYNQLNPDWPDGNMMNNIFNTVKNGLDHMTVGKSFTVKNTSVNATNTCVVACFGASVANLAYGEYNGVSINGNITHVPANANVQGDTMAMIANFGPLTSGFVGLNFPISTEDAGGSGLNIINSTVKSDLEGTAATGIALLSLPGVSAPKTELVDRIKATYDAFFNDSENQLRAQYDAQYGSGWQNDSDLNAQFETDNVMLYATPTPKAATTVVSMLTRTPSLVVTNTSIQGDIKCSVLCGGVAGVSLSRIVADGFSLLGNMVNDNADFLGVDGNPVSMCPVQITGGVVGLQLLMPLTVSNSNIKGNITVNQDANYPHDTYFDVADSMINSSGSYGSSPFDNLNVTGIACQLGSSLMVGTGGVAGAFISPINVSSMIDATGPFPDGTTPDMVATINSTTNSGNITSNNPTATGGLIGVSIGESRINNSRNSGTITNSTFGKLLRTPIASASTGGLVGHSVGGLSIDGNIPEITRAILGIVFGDVNPETIFDDLKDVTGQLQIHPTGVVIEGSSSTGDINTSNTAGGLVGTLSNGGSIHKSFSTGNVYGVTAGGLIGSGVNATSPFGIFGMFTSVDLSDVYSRGDVVASDASNTFTFAGGLVGFMVHLGEFRINNAYTTGEIRVRNNTQGTRLVAGGFVGAELDLSAITQFAKVVVDKSATMETGDEEIDQYIAMADFYGHGALNTLSDLGIPLRYGFSVSNSFTTSKVPANTAAKKDMILKEIATGLPKHGTTSGTMFGFAWTVPESEWGDLVDNVFNTFMNSSEADTQGDNPLSTGLAEGLIDAVSELDWASPAQLAPNSFYDKSATLATACANSLPDVPNLVTFEVGKVSALMDGSSDNLDFTSFIPPVAPLEGTPCGVVNDGTANPNYFKNNTSVAPLNSWSFNSTWYSHANDFPTFVGDPVVDNGGNGGGNGGGGGDTTPPPGTGTGDPGTNGPTRVIPKTITPTQIQETINRLKKTATAEPLTQVLSNRLKATGKSLAKDADKVQGKDKNKGFLATVKGIMSATGMFLLHNLLTVALLLAIGVLLWLYARKKKDGKDDPKSDDRTDLFSGVGL